MSQLMNDDNLNNLINSFKTEFKLNENEILYEEDCDEDVDELDEDDEQKLSNLSKLFRKHLNTLAIEQLNEILTSILSFIYTKIKILARKITSNIYEDEDQQNKKLLFDLFYYIELCFDFIDTNTQQALKFDNFAPLFIVTLKLCYVLFDMLKQMTPDDNENPTASQSEYCNTRTVFISSQISSSVCLNKFNIDLSNRLNAILIKLSNIIEKKMSGFDAANKTMQIKLIYFIVKLIANYIYEAKTMAFIWKVITKIVIKNKLFICANLNDIVITSKSRDNETVKNVFNKLFYSIYKSNYYHLKKLRLDLIKIDKNTNDILKLIKYSTFLFKILKSFASNYVTWLNDTEAFYLLTNVFSLTGFVLLHEQAPLMDKEKRELDIDHSNKEFKQVKSELIKDFAAIYDEAFNLFIDNPDYVQYLNDNNFEKFEKLKSELMDKFHNVYKVIDTENYYEQIEYYEELTLFHSIVLNRCAQMTSSDEINLKLLDKIFELIKLCSRACNLPIYLISFEPFKYNFNKLNELNSKTDLISIEFYEFILINVYAFLFKLLNENSGSLRCLINYLAHMLTIQDEMVKPKNELAVSLSQDVFLLLSEEIVSQNQSNYTLKFFEFICELFEYYKVSSKTNSSPLEKCLTQVIEYYYSIKGDCLPKLLDHLREHKYFNSYSLVFTLVDLKQSLTRNENQYSDTKLTELLVTFYNDLTTFISQTMKQIDQNLLKKLITFIETRNGNQFVNMIGYHLNGSKANLLPQNLIETSCKCLTNFFRLDFLENFLKLFENFMAVSEASKLSSQIYNNFKFIFKFVTNSIKVWSELSSYSNDVDKIALVEFLNKYSARKVDLNKIELVRVLFNFKFLSTYALMLILDSELKDVNLRKKVIDLTFILSKDSNPIVRNLLIKYLSNLASYDHINSKMLAEMIRANSKIKELISIHDIKIEESRTEESVLIERNELIIKELRNKFQKPILFSQKTNDVEMMQKAALDDTMNAIFSMDTTMSTNSQSKSRNQSKKLIEQIEKDLNILIDNYNNDDQPIWLKERLNLLLETYSDKL